MLDHIEHQSLTSDNRRLSDVSPVSEDAGLLTVKHGALGSLAERTREFISAAKAPATQRAYRSDWRHFETWCVAHSLDSLPATPETVALYLTDLADSHRPSTMRRRLTAINKAHQATGHRSPATMDHAVVSETLKGIRRILGTAQACKAAALTPDILKMISLSPDTLIGTRDRAILLVGFAGGFRRSELTALDVGDVENTPDGTIITLKRSKTDQEAGGRKVAIPSGSTPDTCPARALEKWLLRSGIASGALFRGVNRHGRLQAGVLHRDSVGLIVKRAAKRAGLDHLRYAGHSLRAGMATQAYLNGANELSIMRQTGHKSLTTVRRYIRDASLFRDNPAARLGL